MVVSDDWVGNGWVAHASHVGLVRTVWCGLVSGEEPLEAAEWKLQLCTGQAIFQATTASRRMHASCPRSR